MSEKKTPAPEAQTLAYPKQSFDEIVENALRIWFGNFDLMDEDAKATYRVPMRHIVEFAWTQPPPQTTVVTDAQVEAACAQHWSGTWGKRFHDDMTKDQMRRMMRRTLEAAYPPPSTRGMGE